MKVIITGGAGFIGSNAAQRYLRRGESVVVIDNLGREGSRKNLAWLRTLGGNLEFIECDIRDRGSLQSAFSRHRDADRVLHLAAQVAVTTSVQDPQSDFEINALGSLNVLESLRRINSQATIIYSSTNKVYGEMEDLDVALRDGRYSYADLPQGVSEERNLDFHSPYGCSKGCADQYFIDYHRIYGLKTLVFRQSCIYGYRQFGAEDQGWIAWFMIASMLDRPITVFGDGRQVRDILFVDDLVDAYDAGFRAGNRAAGRAFNVGGGPANVLSLVELLAFIEQRRGRKLPHTFDDWRPGDQKVFVSNISRAEKELVWAPATSCAQGLDRLYSWIQLNLPLFEDVSSRLQPAIPVAS